MNAIPENKLTEVRIPFMGSVENVRILQWSVAVGARVETDDVLCEIETDKTVMEIGAPGAGTLVKRVAQDGSDLKVGDLIGYLAPQQLSEEQIADALGAPPAAAAPAPAAALPVAAAAQASGRLSVPSSPYARRLAKEHGIDLGSVTGSGASGRISGADVLQALQARGAPAAAPAAAVPETGSAEVLRGYDDVPSTFKPFSTRRRVIARRLAETARSVPHLTADVQVDMARVLAARKAYNGLRGADGHAPVSVLAFLARAACAALTSHPDLNATYTEAGLRVWSDINLGVAVDTPEGLVVPVIRNADRLSVSGIDAAIKRVAALAREGKLAPSDLDGGTFTISNPGSIGPVLRAEAILNAPQVALLGFPAVQQVPVALADGAGGYTVEVRPVLRPSLTFDHRPLDGGAVVRYLGDFKNRVETMVFDW